MCQGEVEGRSSASLLNQSGLLHRSPKCLWGRRCRVDHLLHFSDFCCRKAADLGVLADYRLVLRQIDAEGLVIRYIALDPLDIGAELVQHFIRLGGSVSKLAALKGADFRDVSLD